jgi:hypothetical protein
MLDQAGLLVRLGVLRLELVQSLRDARAAWEMGRSWIVGMREETQVHELYEHAEWLAGQVKELAARP